MRVSKDTKVAVLMGGWSAEREVSLRSGDACGRALEAAGFRVTLLDVNRNIAEILQEVKPDVAFNALHGRWGEDGTVQGILETLEIPYTHSGVLASAIAMDKEKSKSIFRSAGLPIAESVLVDVEVAAKSHPMALPYVIKPVAQGSSVGVHIVPVGANGPVASIVNERKLYGDKVMVERFIPGRELTCAVMGDVALGVIEIVPTVGFYDYEAKYSPGGSNHVLPAQVPPGIYRRAQQHALAAHHALGCKGISRTDFRYNDAPGGEHELIILEVNTQPGMTGTSLVPELAAHAGHSFEQLVTWIVNDASVNR
jgi:D-alanine-D-alanine ligase